MSRFEPHRHPGPFLDTDEAQEHIRRFHPELSTGRDLSDAEMLQGLNRWTGTALNEAHATAHEHAERQQGRPITAEELGELLGTTKPPAMRRDPEEQRVSVAQAELCVVLDRFAQLHALSDAEMLQALTRWIAMTLKFMLRAERGGRDPGDPAEG